MLGMLLKHEFRATARRMLPTLGVLALLGLLANLSIRVLESGRVGSTLLNFLLGFFVAVFFIGVTVVWIMTLVLMISRFFRNLLKEEGYLMFTLPSDPHALIWSKLIVSTVWFAASALLIVLLMLLTGGNLARISVKDLHAAFVGMDEVMEMLHGLGVTNGSLILLAGELVLASVLTCLVTCLRFYAAMGIGQMSATNKGLWSVLAFIGISIAFQILGTTLFGGLVNSGSLDAAFQSLEELMETAPGVVRAINTGIGSMMLVELLQGAVLYVITALTLSRKLNLA